MRGRRAFACGIAIALTCAADARAAAPDTLSWRLQELSSQDLRDASAVDQGDAVSLLPRGAGSLLRDGGSLIVEVRVSGDLAQRARDLAAAGAEVIGRSGRYDTITASVNEGELRDVGRVNGVEWVGEEITPMTGAVGGDDAVGRAINTCAPGVVSEGDAQLKANQARTQFDVDGSGVKVGVLSDSYDTRPTGINAANDVASGDLPGPGNPCGRTTPVQVLEDLPDTPSTDPIDEGRAMLQIVHDLAPGSNLAFATAFTGQADFADNIRELANAGAKVIVDDIIYFREPMFQDGVIAQAVNEVTAQGVAYFSSAGNNDGLGLNSFEAPNGYRHTACPASVLAQRAGGADSCMDFGGGDPTFDLGLAAGGAPFRLSLSWGEPRFGVTTDFDAYVFNPNTGGSVSLSAEENNLVSQDPTEFGSFNSGGGARQLVIRRFAGTGTPRLKFVSNDNGANTIQSTQTVSSPDVQGPTIYGHNGAANAQSLAAVPYDNSAVVEGFSSNGPVTSLFAPVIGTTPAPPLGSPQTLAKPDVAATDGGINTFFGGGNRFFGTSAAAPHAGAVGALQLEANPGLSGTQVKAAQRNTAINLAAPPEADGSGLIDAVAAIGSAPPPGPTITVQSGTGLTNDDTPTLAFAIAPADPKTLTCSVDGGAPQACSSPFTTGRLADGDHSVSINATDYFNATGSATANVEVDTKKPTVKIKGPKRKTRKERAKFKIKTEAGAGFECKLDKGKFKNCAKKPKFNVDDGKHKLKVTATDAAGNVGKGTYKWKVR